MEKKIYSAPQIEFIEFVMAAALCNNTTSPKPVTEEIGEQASKPGAAAPRRRPF